MNRKEQRTKQKAQATPIDNKTYTLAVTGIPQKHRKPEIYKQNTYTVRKKERKKKRCLEKHYEIKQQQQQ